MKSDLLRSFGPATQLMFVIFIAFVCFFMMQLTAMLIIRPIWQVNIFEDIEIILKLEDQASIHITKLLQVFNMLGMFLFPALIFKNLFSSAEKPFFVLQKKQPINTWVIVSLFFIVSVPLVNYLHWINLQIPVSDTSELDDKAALEMTEKLITASSFSILLINLLVYAVLPAIAEEFFFRGVVLRQVALSTKNVHVAVWVSAALFSFVHNQSTQFIPRFIMGAGLGYILVWSGSIWMSVLAHFINNLFLIITTDFILRGKLDEDFAIVGMRSEDTMYVIASVLLTAGGIYLLVRSRNGAYRTFMENYEREDMERMYKDDETIDHQE